MQATAFLAMTHFKLGDLARARVFLDQLRRQEGWMNRDKASFDVALFAEADALIAKAAERK